MRGVLNREVFQSEKSGRWYYKVSENGENIARCRPRGFSTEEEADGMCRRYANLPPFRSLSVWVALPVVAGAAFALGAVIL